MEEHDHEKAAQSYRLTERPLSYRGGHLDTSIESFPMYLNTPLFKTGWLPIGDAHDGPALAIVSIGPGLENFEGEAHHHNSDQVRIILDGSMKIGRKWYRKGDVRIQQAGRPYGPEKHGPEGSVELLFFSDRRAMMPQYRATDAGMFGMMMRMTGIEPT